MTQGISLIAGLGTSGPEYAETRHNAGFLFVGALAAGRADWRHEARIGGRCARVAIAGRELWLLCPDAFMNHSGEAVGRLARYYKIPPEQILIVHDDLDLPPGAARLKFGGGDSGHNGVADVIEQLGTNDFHRLRIGIGPLPRGLDGWHDYVLEPMPRAERHDVEVLFPDMCEAVECWMSEGIAAAMARFNRRKTTPEE